MNLRFFRALLTTLLSGLTSISADALAQTPVAPDYPTRPVRVIVPFAPGAASDITGRLVAQKLAEALGQQFIVDNRPGAGGNIGHEIAAKAAADGYTLVIANESLAINASLSRNLGFDTARDFAAISQVTSNPRVFVTAVASPYESMRDLLNAARAKPGSVKYGSSGVGTGPHLAAALLAGMAKVEMTHIPYKGAAPALTDVLGGQIETIATTILSSQSLIQGGKLRALAVTSARRSSALPAVPTVAEGGLPGFEATSWLILLGPAKMPRPLVQRLQKETARFLDQAEVRKRILADGGEPVGSTPQQAADYLKAEIERWGRVIRDARVKPD
jgi:tripartite-type tricarboxylate transporter receptor subunit TctC